MSQEELAKKSGIKQPSLSDIESGKTKIPRNTTVRAIAVALNDNLGNPELDKHLGNEIFPDRQKVIISATADEVTNTLKFNAGSGRYTKEEILKIKQQADIALKEIDKRNEGRKSNE